MRSGIEAHFIKIITTCFSKRFSCKTRKYCWQYFCLSLNSLRRNSEYLSQFWTLNRTESSSNLEKIKIERDFCLVQSQLFRSALWFSARLHFLWNACWIPKWFSNSNDPCLTSTHPIPPSFYCQQPCQPYQPGLSNKNSLVFATLFRKLVRIGWNLHSHFFADGRVRKMCTSRFLFIQDILW